MGEILSRLVVGFGLVMAIQPILMIFFGVTLGIILGALPGLTATMGVAILMPLTFFMEPIPGISFLLGVYCGGIYGGSITAILIKTPGTPSAAATLLDGYPLAQKGQALKALEMALYASVISGLISAFMLIFVAPPLASIALRFGPPEYFALGLFGLTIVATVSGKELVKGLIAASIGLLFSFIGLDPIAGSPRLTFGIVNLQSGIELIPALIGLFAVGEVMVQTEQSWAKAVHAIKVTGERLKLQELRECMFTIIRSSLIGTFIGAVPGTGAGVSAFVSYNEAHRTSKRRKEFGEGCLEGVAAAEAGNNGVTGATLIPLLTLGIPGDSVTAVLLGALMVQGLTPGPMIFQKSGDIIFGIFAGLILCNIVMLIVGYLGVKIFYKVTAVQPYLLYPVIFALCSVGAFAVNTRLSDVYIMLFFGLLGYVMQKFGFPTAPVLLALILGPLTESNLRRGLVATRGNIAAFLFRPLTMVFLLISVASIVFFIAREALEARKIGRQAQKQAN